MTFLKSFLLISAIFISSNALAVKYHEFADEGPFISIYLGKDLTGYVKSRMCKECKVITHKIHSEVKAFLDGKEVPLKTFVLTAHKPSVVHFSTESKKMTRIIWYSKNK